MTDKLQELDRLRLQVSQSRESVSQSQESPTQLKTRGANQDQYKIQVVKQKSGSSNLRQIRDFSSTDPLLKLKLKEDGSLTEKVTPKNKIFLYKRAASQQQLLLSHLPSYQLQQQNNYQTALSETVDTFLKPLPKQKPSNIKIENDRYTFYQTQTGPSAFKGMLIDTHGKLIPRRLIGSVDQYREFEQKTKSIINLKNISQKASLRPNGSNSTLLSKIKTKSLNEIMSQQRSSRDGSSRDLMSQRTRPLIAKTSFRGSLGQLAVMGALSTYGAVGVGQAITEESQNNNSTKNRYIKFPDSSLRETITSIKDRIQTQQNSLNSTQQKFNMTGFTTLTAATSKSNIIGNLLKEVQQDRILAQHQEYQKTWQNIAHKSNQKFFEKNKMSKIVSKLKKQNEGNFESVMMRDRAYLQKVQSINAVAHLRSQQHVNHNVNWIFSLRQSQMDKPSHQQQYLPSHTHLNAVIVPSESNVKEVFLKQDFSNDSFDDEEEEDQVEEGYGLESNSRRKKLIDESAKKELGIIITDLDQQSTSDLALQQSQLTLREFSVNPSLSTTPVRTLGRIKSEHKFHQWEAYKKVMQKEGQSVNQVLLNTSFKNLRKLKITGSSKLQAEIEASIQVPESSRKFLLNHQYTQEGEGEPVLREEILAECYDYKR